MLRCFRRHVYTGSSGLCTCWHEYHHGFLPFPPSFWGSRTEGRGCCLHWCDDGGNRPFTVSCHPEFWELVRLFSRHMVSYFSWSQVQWILWNLHLFLCLRSLHKGKALSAPGSAQPIRLLVPQQSLFLALFYFLKQSNRKPIQCSFQWPWCASIYKLAKQSASFIESISLCARLWSFSYLHNWGQYIGHKSTNPILSCMEMFACLYCYFVYHCL